MDDKSVYLADDQDNVHALDREGGASRWKQDKLLRRKLTAPVVVDGKVVVGDSLATLEVRINPTLAQGCAGYGFGLAGAENLQPLQAVELRRAENWQRRQPQVIGSDRPGAGHV